MQIGAAKKKKIRRLTLKLGFGVKYSLDKVRILK